MAQIPSSYYTVPFNAVYDTAIVNYERPVAPTELFLMPYVAPQVLMQLDGVMLDGVITETITETVTETTTTRKAKRVCHRACFF